MDQLQGVVGYTMYTVGLDVLYYIANLMNIIVFSVIFILIIDVLTYKKIFFSCLTSLYGQSVYIANFAVIYCFWLKFPQFFLYNFKGLSWYWNLEGVPPYPYLSHPLQSSVMPLKITTKLDPWFVTGFTDAEGSFILSISPSSRYKLGWSVTVCFQIVLHIKDIDLLYKIKEFFGGVGSIVKYKRRCNYIVNGHSDLINVILPHFDVFPLITQKRADYLLFRMALLDYIKYKKHLTMTGIESLVSIRASINLGLKDNLNKAFSSVVPVARPVVYNQFVPHEMWMAGFSSGEGCFFIHARPPRKISLLFQIAQHIRDSKLINGFVVYLGGGRYSESLDDNMSYYKCENLDIFLDKIIPFFKNYPILGVKAKDFADFVFVANLMKRKVHLTEKGFKQILLIKNGMNKGRKF